MSDEIAFAALPGQPLPMATVGLPGTDRRLAIFGGLMIVAGLLAGTSSGATLEFARLPAPAYERWTNNGIWNITAAQHEQIPSSVWGTSLKDSVLSLRELSGLTWDQLAKLFGVSRRAIHLWASGGRMNSAHAERLAQILMVVGNIDAASSATRRDMLLAARADGRSLYESLLEDVKTGKGINGPAFRPEQLVQALHDRSD